MTPSIFDFFAARRPKDMKLGHPMTMRAIRLGLTAGTVALAGALVLGQQPPPAGQGRGGAGQGQAQGQAQTRDREQAVPVGTGAIGGFVVAEGAGTPVRRARVNLSGAAIRGGRSAMTTDEGRFSFTGLPAGTLHDDGVEGRLRRHHLRREARRPARHADRARRRTEDRQGRHQPPEGRRRHRRRHRRQRRAVARHDRPRATSS